MRYDCELIQDLLPLYVDDTLSDYSRAVVEAHLTSCKDCQIDLADLRQDYSKVEEELQEYQAEVCAFSRFIRKQRQQMIVATISICLVTGILSSILTAHRIQAPYDYVAIDVGEHTQLNKEGLLSTARITAKDHVALVYKHKAQKVNGSFKLSELQARKIQQQLKQAMLNKTNTSDASSRQLDQSQKRLSCNQADQLVYVVSTDGRIYYFGR
ncbi:TPA: zf-HC2 domain-containing protein [Streptococcus equi subsp. zooepidemicus]|uniref:zf-HC2 domain-containing protein n=1 Tax=Streptococcus equi TaxID=1336 RepID=UPI0013F6278F|nr:zf-HC2 domain-containing protein [Streptococcus equi]HEL0027452.1 zf-HC2 domain-containing protein [Streptococcus equi subsp. zooepidemicus]HEL0821586.1 zf-HC2 domain-containing protein [Streptococcus equi subsp. zooepidemicus]HEL1303795.1 zf-HC2 domain-containing protein [Streptococcus equi subsp. zooepidemicus]HEL1316904.1 zf-HC2 domain-containing protein [Streptococcus equi subsp. zooepidemicus]HEL1332500.1 zf-HC2 domain-containing protein [Streptococcus equi subsp. zooepidemicus]